MADFLGLTLPVEQRDGGFWATRATTPIIRADIQMLLQTKIGERVMLPEYGSRIPELVFEPNDDVLKALAKTYVIDAIRRWERRIDILDAQVVSEEHEFRISLRYFIHANASTDALVLSFNREV